jgi:hypothetical protein
MWRRRWPPIIAHCWVDENLVSRQLVGKEPESRAIERNIVLSSTC